jgi:uncharacterized glyoxalase superfamily protein PhnB
MNANVFPNLGYRDARAAIRFLIEAFGFEEVAVYDGEREGSIGHADLRWPAGGAVSLHSAEPGGAHAGAVRRRAAATPSRKPIALEAGRRPRARPARTAPRNRERPHRRPGL